MERIRISVRSLVEFILRSGDIDNRRGGMAEKEAMQMGGRLHRKIQGQMGASYRAEVSLKKELEYDTFLLSVEGRADGIFTEEKKTWVDEIKGVSRDVKKMEEAVQVHLAQAKCYAYIYAQEHGLLEIGVQMTYVNLETEEIRRFRHLFSAKELDGWFQELIGQYRKWAEFQVAWKKTRQASIAGVRFPYPYREGQKKLAASVYRTIERRKKLFIQAPTGVGKTIAAVFPAVKAVGEGYGDRIFYLTAKTITRTVAQEAFALLKEQGLRYKVLTLTAKEKICMCTEPDCNPESCPYAKGHFDRVNDAIYELLTGWEHISGIGIAVSDVKDSYTREDILAHAQKWKVCPFELALDLSLWMDAVICDYNYVFDPQAKLKRFFADGIKGDYIFLIDEAHNLVERGRDMYSAALYKEDFLEMKRVLAPFSAKLVRALGKCNKYLLEQKRGCETYVLLSGIDAFVPPLLNVSALLSELLEDEKSPWNRFLHGKERGMEPDGQLSLEVQNGGASDGTGLEDGPPGEEAQLPARREKEDLRKKVLEFYFQVQRFLAVYEGLDDGYQIYVQHEADGRFKIKLYCIHPAGKLGECLRKGRGSVLFSATLLPVRYYMDLLSGTDEDYAVYAQSPFPPEHKKVLVGVDVSSRYTRRNEAEYRRIAAYIRETVNARRGNYLVFFPSYKMLEEVQQIFLEETPPGTQVIAQNARMTEGQREEFLEEFSADRTDSLVGFCVLGGIFGEGIDLKKKRLIGAIIVGTGLPLVCEEREILKQYYEKRGMDGFAYAYQYPGMNKVLQSAGRVIRTDEDRGVILLLDDRFCQGRYRDIFPREWADYERCSLRDAPGKLRDFWAGQEVPGCREET